MELDHVVLAAPDLDEAKRAVFDAAGVEPIDGGPHVGGGTRNALIAFSGGQYLEIIAPDPQQRIAGTLGERFAALEAPAILHWAVRTSGSAGLAGDLDAKAIGHSPVRRMSRATPAGEKLEWELMAVTGHGEGGLVPFFIDWLECRHPSVTSPKVGALTTFRVSAPADALVRRVLAAALAQVEVVDGTPGLTVEFDSPNGAIRYDVSHPEGFAFR